MPDDERVERAAKATDERVECVWRVLASGLPDDFPVDVDGPLMSRARQIVAALDALAAAPVSDAKGREKLSRAIGLAESIARIPGLGYEVNKQGVYEIAAEIVELLRAVSGEDKER